MSFLPSNLIDEISLNSEALSAPQINKAFNQHGIGEKKKKISVNDLI